MPELRLENVSVYLKNRKIVKSFNLEINDGELHVLMGPNGSGKTTLIKAIAGHRDYRLEGKVFLDNEDITGLKVHEKALKGLAIALQEPPSLEGLRVGEVLIKIAKKFRKLNDLEASKMVSDVLNIVGLDQKTLSKYYMTEFSGGEKRKLELAKILLMNPKVAILDEPDSGVDIDSIPRIATVVSKLTSSGSSVLLVTHQFGLFDYLRPTKVHIMISGEKVLESSHDIIERLKKEGYRVVKNGSE